MGDEWEQIDTSTDVATKEQRRALYRLGMAPSVVRRLSTSQAATYIQATLTARQAAGPTAVAKEQADIE